MNIKTLLTNISKEEARNNQFLHLTANEAQMSNTARMFLGSHLSERYYAGFGPQDIIDNNPFTMLSLNAVSTLVDEASNAAKQMLHACAVNLNPLSGVHAMMCSLLSTTQPGDTVMIVPHYAGGHFATPGILATIGRKAVYATYDIHTLSFNVGEIKKTFEKSKARAFYMDVSYYINPHNLQEIRKALGKKAIIIYDASHTMGLIMGQQFQSPLLEGADVISANTHKTLPGPQKGMIAFKNKSLADRANKIINSSLYSSPHTHHMIALATTILELKMYGKAYAKQVIANSNAIGEAFTKIGYEVRRANTGRFSENHQCHVFIDNTKNRIKLYKSLIKNNISTNFDANILGERLYIRIGTQEVTRRGMKESDMIKIASLIDCAFKGENIKKEVIAFNKKFTKIHYSFD